MPDARTTTRRAVLRSGAAVTGAAALGAAAPATAQAAPEPPRPRVTAKVGFVLSHEQFRTQSLVSWASQAEAVGFSHVWTSDHLQPWEDVQGHSMHPWITHGIISHTTSRVHFGTGVTCPTYRHHPSEVAQAFASLGILAPGRVFLGVGTGEALNEQAGTGSFGPYAERAARLVEAVQLIRRLWEGQRVSFRGTYYTVDQFQLYDVPSKPVPILMAASGPKSAYNAGRYGDGWICSAKDLMKPELQAAFAQGARDAGKDPDTMPKYAESFVNIGGPAELLYSGVRWRFTYDSWNPELLYEPNPLRIQQKAAASFSLAQATAAWPKGPDPDVHIKAAQKILDMGGTPFIHSGEHDQPGVIEFYGKNVLPRLTA
ncbi:TAT-translocated FGD2 family F420-dependent dehydrogenase [Motilibacter peucedani]|uniref:TAT-translocated FGD2 family F420-dependent dehydrogenase n=1 Tax=Motilibacter peucedani TaxID=598650 RepID=A0A420XP64_9ACTN|nr:TIGR03557 family F420-dependent LLM class oxidoreductase [Motilibacter peucedani]RKS73974.1 TAT-translocated FGD2 family F420-dependent dehydrogenase [Motilibacter peucedani]